MSHKLQPVRGTKDILPDEQRLFSYVVDKAKNISALYGFKEFSTPIFEFTDIFKKTLGEESDVVGKEMYSFEDRGGESITLRPEFTAGVARAFISGGLTNQLPLKLFSYGPLFRYERPQKGRQRQFHQINCEFLGIAEAGADIELISMAAQILDELGILKKTTLEINSLGDSESRVAYRDALVAYFNGYKDELSEDSKIRLIKNPMRILDSKDEGDKKIVAGAPVIAEYYNSQSADFFEEVRIGLKDLGVDYQVNQRLVRGLDYYCHTAFEFTTNDLGAQNTVLAGGRYDKLIGNMGGNDTPAVGFAGGIERIALLAEVSVKEARPIAIVPIGELAEHEAAKLASVLRKAGFYIEIGYSGNVKKRMKRANSVNAAAGVIIGDDEIKQGIVKLKDFDSGEEKQVAIAALVDKLSVYR